MMKWFSSVGFALCVLSYASIAAAVPDWCKGSDGQKVDVHGGLDTAISGTDATSSIHDIVGAECFPDDWARKDMDKIEAHRKVWSAKLDMNDADWSDAAAWSTWQASDRNGKMLRIDEKKAWSTYDAIDQYLGLNFDIQENYDANYMADAFGPKLSEAGRLAYIRQCLREGSMPSPVQWAMCQPDIDVWDFKKLSAELHADKKHTPFERFTIRLAGYGVAERLKARAAKVAELKAKDPAYGKMFELAAASRKDWEKLWASSSALLELVMRMDDARVSSSRRALEGCDDTTWAAWQKAVAATPAKKFAEFHRGDEQHDWLQGIIGAVLGEPQGYLAGLAMVMCKQQDKPDVIVRLAGKAMERWPGFRGPRNATSTAVYAAGLELDDRTEKIIYPDMHRAWLSFMKSGAASGGGEGTIKALKPQGDTITVEFVPKMEKQMNCAQSKTTNRITQIRSDGGLVYQTLCLKEVGVMVNRASPPQTIRARYATGLKAGMYVVVEGDTVPAAWAKPGVNAPSIVSATPVK